MFSLFLKDGSKKEFAHPVTGVQLAESISKNLAKEAVAIKVNGELWDLSRLLIPSSSVDIIKKGSSESLDLLRHDTAHVFAAALKELFPETQITIGPSIDNGFYYDVYREVPFTSDQFQAIEKKMAEIVDRNDLFIREEWDRDKAIAFFESMGETFKAELIRDLPENEIITLYRQGQFIDLCRGPHMPSTAYIGKAFKLMRLAGAYWRGDHRNPMLQRFYGTAWFSEKELALYLYQLEEAEKRDHRRLGKQLNLFHLQEEALGSVFWHPKGWALYRTLQEFMRSHLNKHNYKEVSTPQLVDRTLWEQSGHWDKFGDHMFTVATEEGRTLAIKPMNCPCHVQIFKQGLKSYRDLPLRLSEFGSCHRDEPSGALHGLMRLRAFLQDDAHIFCTPSQIVDETKLFCDLLKEIYSLLGFTDIRVKFSDRPEKRAGDDSIWDTAEHSLLEAAQAADLEYTLNPGEGAFYGPKLEFVLKDTLGRDWQCGTLQVDFVLPNRLGAHYIDEKGNRQHPVMLHRAVLGSFERFIGVLIEHYGGAFPFWLAPVQMIICPVTNQTEAYAHKVYSELLEKNIRCEVDRRNEKISYKIREHSLQKIPYILILGQKEQEENKITFRHFGTQHQKTLTIEEFLTELRQG